MLSRIISRSPKGTMRAHYLCIRFQVEYHEHGVATDVLKLVETPALKKEDISENEVFVQMLAAPINPADINMAEGVYGINPTLPAIAGNEGVGQVISLGNKVTNLKKGDWVIPTTPASGTWRSEIILKDNELLKISNNIGLAEAATITVNPATAYRMLKDFIQLKKGDVIIQNGANSAVGLAVIQMARLMGIHTINIIRHDRTNLDETLRLLTNLGGDINIPDNMLDTPELDKLLSDLPSKPILGLNCIGGEATTKLVKTMNDGGIVVTYGGMSKRPLKLPIDLITTKNLTFRGFWVSAWYQTCSIDERLEMMNEICDMIKNDQLISFNQMHNIDQFDNALKVSQTPMQFRKVVLNLSPNQ